MTVNASKAQRGKDIRYILVELLIKEDKKITVPIADKEKIEFGLLRGIQSRTDDEDSVFILLEQAKKITKLCNLRAYTILSIEIYDGTEREIIFFRVCENDQDAAAEILNDSMEQLKEAGRLTANQCVVNTETYSDVPADFEERVTGTKKTTSTSSLGSRTGSYTPPGYPQVYGNTGTAGVGAAHHSTTYTTKDGDKKPTVLKRTSKKPTKNALDKMKEMVLLIAAGKFEQKPFPTIVKDEDTEEEKEAAKRRVVTSTTEDEFAGYGMMY